VQDDFDLEGLSAAEARAYVARFITAQKQVERDRSEAEGAVELWKKRVRLAMERGEDELARECLQRAEEAHDSVVKLKAEERDLSFKVGELKRRLVKLGQEPQFSVDAGALLDQLEGVVGSDHETSDAIRDAEAQVALEELKKRMESEGDG